MKTLGNILWFLIVGLASAIGWFFAGIIWCITIIGIPFGKQCFKIAGLSLAPFGKTVDSNFGSHPIANILWFILCGFGFAVGYFFTGLILCITIIGIPAGKQCFKLAKIGAFPFGSTVC